MSAPLDARDVGAPIDTRDAMGLDSWRSITALLWLGFVGLATFQLIPLLTGQLVDVYGFGDAKAGLISSWYCGAGFIASVIALSVGESGDQAAFFSMKSWYFLPSMMSSALAPSLAA